MDHLWCAPSAHWDIDQDSDEDHDRQSCERSKVKSEEEFTRSRYAATVDATAAWTTPDSAFAHDHVFAPIAPAVGLM